MGMRSSLDPFSGDDQIIDQMVGRAYADVKKVADNLNSVEALAQQIGVVGAIEVVFDGGMFPIEAGSCVDIEVGFTAQILGWKIMADRPGSIAVDVWRDVFANFPPTPADSITGTAKPSLAGVNKNAGTPNNTWNKTINAGDILRFSVLDGVVDVRRITLSLKIQRNIT